ncbi:MAG: efflux RND transporter permease subunit [Cyclobacteriaceae bacterium]|nr:efflux RND transporter permease subunit [Cyclobacteriaceae bacterium]
MTRVALLVLGIATSTQLPVSLLPDTPVPIISVHINKPNLSARELENTIATPIRRYLLQTAHLENISSRTRIMEDVVIEMNFAFGTDIDLAFLETSEKIDLAMHQMPRDMQRPRVIKASATDIPAFYLNLTLKQTSHPGGDSKQISQEFIDLSNFSHQVIRKRLEQTAEVALVDMSGMVFPEIMITPDWDKLAALNISLDALENAIKHSNISLGNLTILDGQYQYNVRFSAAINNIRDIEDIFIKVAERVFRLKELVSVKQQPQQPQGYVIANGKQAITMAVIKRGDAQMDVLKESLENLIKSFEYDYPHIDFTITRDQTRLLEYSVSNLKQGLVWSAALAFLVNVFLFAQRKVAGINRYQYSYCPYHFASSEFTYLTFRSTSFPCLDLYSVWVMMR